MLNFVSVIIPCRNEERYIAQCLSSIIQQDYSKDQIEILVADGMSTDKTREILEEYSKQYSQIRWFDNPGKIVPVGLNILIRIASGNIIVRLDAHADYPKDYLRKCVGALEGTGADNVGGVCITLPGADTLTAKAIALALSSNFGVGNALFRTGVKGITSVDTVPFGCFRRDVFDRFGMFDEDLVRGQDSEFNHRIVKGGGKIFLVPGIVSYYNARDTFGKLAKMYSQYGYFKAFVGKKLQTVLTIRQIIPSLFVLSVVFFFIAGFFHSEFFWFCAGELVLYLIVNFVFSAKLAVTKDFRLFPFLVFGFFIIHVNYGVHYLRGFLDFWILKKHLHNKICDVALTR